MLWDLSTYEVSCWYLKGFFLVKLWTKNLAWKITKGNNWKIMQGTVIILVCCTSPQWDLSTYEDVSNWDKLRTKSMKNNKRQYLKNDNGKSNRSCAQYSSSIRSIYLWRFFELCPTQVKIKYEHNKGQLLKDCEGKSYHSCALHTSWVICIHLWSFMLISLKAFWVMLWKKISLKNN
jgi:hypothetical protein